MPKPNKGESREEYIARFMSSEEAKKSFPDEKQRLAAAYSYWRKHGGKNKEAITYFSAVKVKEESDVYEFIGANTLPDRTKERLPDGTVIEGEILSKNVLERIAENINNESVSGGKYGSYRTISLFHNRVHERNFGLEEAGYVVPGSAKVVDLPGFPGNYGVSVGVEVNEKFVPPNNYSDYTPEKIKYKIDKGAIGLSLEYNNDPEDERIVDFEGKKYRYVMDTNDFRGFGFARVDLIGNTGAVRIKEVYPSLGGDEIKKLVKMKEGDEKMSEDAKSKELETQLADSQAKIKELQEKVSAAEKLGEEAKMKEFKKEIDVMEAKVKEMKLSQDVMAAKLKESIELAFSGLKFEKPGVPMEKNAKVKEIYSNVEKMDFVKFKEMSAEHIEKNDAKLKEMMARDGAGFDFEKWQTLKVKCQGNKLIVVPSAKTKDAIDTTDMNEATYYQTNAMFADKYVAGITETFLKEDSLLKVIPKEQHIGGNDKYQWKVWDAYCTVTGTSTAAVDPNTTSVGRTQRDFLKLETPIREYRDGVEVTDFTQAHSMAAVGSLMDIEIQRAAEYVTESLNSDLFKSKCDSTSGWLGVNGLLGFADAATHTTLYGRTRSSFSNSLYDSTAANTYLATSEGISVSVVRSGYEKVLAHGSRLGDLVIVAHPTQVRRLFDAEDADIRHQVVSMAAAPASFGFNRAVIPYVDGIPIIRDYRCESSAAAADMFVVVDVSPDKGFNLIVSKPLGVRGLAKLGTSESAYVSFWGTTVYKAPRNVFAHAGLTAT